MKSFLFYLLLTLSLTADSLHKNTLICVHSITIEEYEGKGVYCYTKSSGGSECDLNATYDSFVTGYTYTDGKCTIKNDLKITGLTQEQWSFSMALLAHFLGFTQLFLINFLVILVARR